MSPILFFIIFFICTGVGKNLLQINSAAVAFIDILIAEWEGLNHVNGSACRKTAQNAQRMVEKYNSLRIT